MIAGDLIEPRGRSMARWAAAAMLMTSVHVGGSYAMFHWPEALYDESSGAIVVEIAPVATALAVEAMDLPPGPLAEEAAASQPSAKPVPEEVVEDAPKEDMPSPAPDPEVALPKPTKAEEKPEEEPKEDPTPTAEAAQQQVAAAKTTAPAKVEAELSTRSAAPEAGTSASDRRSIASFYNSVVLHIHKHKRYPAQARRDGDQGDVKVRFVVDRSGRLVASEIVTSSGKDALDEEALELLKRASPLPRPPVAVTGETLEFVVPFNFRLR